MLKSLKDNILNRGASKSKQDEEIDFWKDEIKRYILWYRGDLRNHYGIKSPAPKQKVNVQNEKDSAVLTWLSLHQKPKYHLDLQVSITSFDGMKVLDIGAGPMPSALVFKGINLYCLDPLYADYLKAGFSLHYYENTHFVNAQSEAIPIKDNFFDAVISVNAIDHVDDLHETAEEIKRVLKPGGKFAMHVHYHEATPAEPIEITDELFLKEFGWCKNLKKVSESIKKTGSMADKGELYAVWRNF